MQISKKMDVNATPEQIDDKLNRLDEMAGDKVPNLKAERNSDGTYTFKTSLKMGLFPIKIKVDLAIKPVKRLSNYDLELKSKLFGKKLDGEGSLAIRPKSKSVTEIELTLDAGSGGTVSGMLGGEGAAREKMEGFMGNVLGSIDWAK